MNFCLKVTNDREFTADPCYVTGLIKLFQMFDRVGMKVSKGHDGYVGPGIKYTRATVVEVLGLGVEVDSEETGVDLCRGRVVNGSGVQGSRGAVRVDRVSARLTGL